MKDDAAVTVFTALAHPGRLAVLRLLVRAGDNGLASGEIARQLAMVPQTLSGNLNVLAQAGLIEPSRRGRFIIYTAQYDVIRALLGFLMDDCCAGVFTSEVVAGDGCCEAVDAD